MRDDFCILISSYNRAGNIPTIKSLERAGYTGDWFIVIDNESDKEPYYKEYGKEKVIYFSKDDVKHMIDRGDNFERKTGILYFRFYSFYIAEEMGYKYFMQLDDDYTDFRFKFDENFNYVHRIQMEDLDKYFNDTIEYLENTNIYTVCMAQGGDFIGGSDSGISDKVKTKRKAMNTFICSVDRKIEFKGSINEDVNSYVRDQQLGKVMLTVNFTAVQQELTQKTEGGMTEIYADAGTYIKSFYTILYSPSSVSLMLMGNKYKRIHHHVHWNRSVPKIIEEKYKK